KLLLLGTISPLGRISFLALVRYLRPDGLAVCRGERRRMPVLRGRAPILRSGWASRQREDEERCSIAERCSSFHSRSEDLLVSEHSKQGTGHSPAETRRGRTRRTEPR